MSGPRRWRWWWCAAVTVATIGLAAPGVVTAAPDPAPPTPTEPDNPPVTTQAETAGTAGTTGTGIAGNEFLPEERNLGDCLGALERPGCGSDERGGWRQTLIFAVLVTVLALGAWRIVVMVRRRDKALATETGSTETGSTLPTEPTEPPPGPHRPPPPDAGREDDPDGR